MSRSVIVRVCAGLLAASLVAASCGGDDGEEGTAATIDAGVKEALGGTTPGQTTTTIKTPTSMDEWEALWAQQRAAIVKRIKDNGWGKSADGKTVTGPEGFTIDLSKCPAGWSDTEGLTDTSIKVGLAVAQSGSFASYNNYTKGMQVVYDHYNSTGAFKDVNGKTRKIDLIAKDDGYDPARTIPLVTEFLDSDKVFAVWTLGSPNTLKTYDNINARCVPHPLPITAHAAWGDPVNHPWTTSSGGLSYSSEAIFWGAFIEEHIDEFDDPIKVAALVMNNDFGKLYDASFRAYVAQSPVLKDRIDYTTEQIEAATPQITDPMTTLAAEDPDVFILMAAATPCTQAVAEAAQNGMKESTEYLFQPLTCAGTQFVKKEAVGGDGSTADGWWIVTYGLKDLTDPAFQDDAFVEWARDLLEKAGTPAETSSILTGGVGLGWAFTQFAMIAGQLPGRTDAHQLRPGPAGDGHDEPAVHSAASASTPNGNADPYFIETGQYNKWDAAKQSWIPQGDALDLDGKSKPCAWDAAASVCR